jgi:hypothetical protein
MSARADYLRQQRYWASGLVGEPNDDVERAFWMAWDRRWISKRPGYRATRRILPLLLLAAAIDFVFGGGS